MLVSKNIIYINFNIIDYNYSIYIQDYLFNKILFISLFNKYINKISIVKLIIKDPKPKDRNKESNNKNGITLFL